MEEVTTKDRHLRLRAAAGRVVLRFPRGMEESSGGIAIPESSQQRLEMAEVYDVGRATNPGDEAHRQWLLDQQAAGQPVMADFGAGIGLWKQNYDTRWKWLRDFRVYTLSQPFITIEEVSPEVAAEDDRVVTLTFSRKDSPILAPSDADIRSIIKGPVH